MTRRQKQRIIDNLNPFRFLSPAGFSSLLFVVSLFVAVPLWATTSTATNGGAMGASTGLGGSTGQGSTATVDTNIQNGGSIPQTSGDVNSPTVFPATSAYSSTQGGVQFGPGPQFSTETPKQNNATNNQSQNGSMNPYAGNAQPSCANGLSSGNCGSAPGTSQ